MKRSPVIRRYFLLLACSAVIAGCETVPTESSSKTGAPSGGKPATETIASTDPDHSKPASNSAAPAAPAVDLWARIRDGYAIPDHNNARVKQQFSAYAGRKDYWLRVSERATPYLHLIVEAIDERGLPQELALLPVVESGFQPFAYSHGRAAGIWQFIPATGRHYGLKQNWWYDGRRDVTAATEAALDYLTYLNEMFDGDWLLALAAYNAGEGTVSRAIKRNRQAGRATDYWSLDLPRETMHYVPRLLAVSEIVAHPERHDIALTPISNEPAVAVVDLEHQVDLALAAELAEIDIETLYALNPGFNRWATAPEGPHRLLLPYERASAFQARLRETPSDAWMRWQRHRIAPGETLGAIAGRYRISVSALQQANDIESHVIRAGDHLLVPVASRPSEQYSLSADARQAATQASNRDNRTRRNHIVQAGESFWVIAQRYGVGVRELAGWNGMAPTDTLAVGEQLAVWTNAQASAATTSNSSRTVSPAERMQTVNYRVRQGDSLYAIAQRFNVSVNDLQRWNDIATNRYLQPGQRLRMQVDVTAQGAR